MLYVWMLTCQKNKDGLGTPRCHYISKETLAQIELVLLLCVLYILHREKKYNPNEADWDHLLADEGQEKQEMVGAPQEM